MPQQQKAHQYTFTYGLPHAGDRRVRFSVKELEHLGLAALLVLGVALSTRVFIVFQDYLSLGLFAVLITISFFIHELAHKFVAQKEGFWAEFRLTLWGAALTLISVISPIFKIISPGAVMIAGVSDRKTIGKTSIAGPLTNIILGAVFLGCMLVAPSEYVVVFLLVAAFSAWIALFNLIPFGILDGFKIFTWNKKIWTLTFAASLILTVISYQFLNSSLF
jgi:Zn-dependent protease